MLGWEGKKRGKTEGGRGAGGRGRNLVEIDSFATDFGAVVMAVCDSSITISLLPDRKEGRKTRQL